MNITNPILNNTINILNSETSRANARNVSNIFLELFRNYTLYVLGGIALIIIVVAFLTKQWLDVAEGKSQNVVFDLTVYFVWFVFVVGLLIFLNSTTGIAVVENIKFW